MVAGGEREVAVPGDELFAFAVAADPFELAVCGPVDWDLGGRGEFYGGVLGCCQKLIDCCLT